MLTLDELRKYESRMSSIGSLVEAMNPAQGVKPCHSEQLRRIVQDAVKDRERESLCFIGPPFNRGLSKARRDREGCYAGAPRAFRPLNCFRAILM